jgi:NADPH:quinone reductase-like Zn-dependent oxidoreductase
MVIDRFGGPEVFRMGEIPMPVPGPDEVVIRVAYAGVNPADWKCREGWLSQFFDYKFPFVVGFDAAGIVSAVGPGVTAYKVGDKVTTHSNQGIGENGSYAEYVKSVTDRCAHVADGVSYPVAASIPTAAVTSWEACFDTGGLKAGQTVLINGGAGGMGSFAIQFAKHAGAKVAVTCSAHNIDYVKSLGADRAIDYRAEDVEKEVLAWAPGGVDLVIDTVGQGTLLGALNMTKRGGKITPIGTLIVDEPMIEKEEAAKRGVEFIPTMSNRTRAGDQLRLILDLYNQGKLQPPQIEVLELSQAGEAHTRVKDGHVRGKIVLHVADL